MRRGLALVPFLAALGVALSAFARPAAASGGAGDLEANIFVPLAKKIVPSVVNISTLSTIKSPLGQGAPGDLFRRFFDDYFQGRGGGAPPNDGSPDDDSGDDGGGDRTPAPQQHRKAMSLGTGFIIDPNGLILTNNHVVADADEIKINFTDAPDEAPTDGQVVGRDPDLDVALIRVKTDRTLSAVAFGDSDALEVGEYVIAVGNPFGQGHSVTHGIISAKGRLAPEFPIANYLQTDAPINPGNSGGPLVNLKGEVIGINNAIDQRAQGIGFAIPINFVKKILPQLRAKGSVERGFIGVVVGELTPEIARKIGAPKGLRAPFVTNVTPGTPADKAGIRNYDVITQFDGKAIHTGLELVGAVTSVEVGQTVPVRVLRAGRERTFEIKVTQRPGQGQLAEGEKNEPKKGKHSGAHIDAGMTLEDISPEMAHDLGLGPKEKGVVIMSINYGGPADKSGLARGDVILEVDRKPVRDVEAFYAHVKTKKSYLLRVRRLDPQGHESFTVIILDLKS